MSPLSLNGLLESFTSLTETIFFWIGWGFISGGIVPRLYAQRNRSLIEQLRAVIILIQIAIVFLLFLPWASRPIGYANGVDLILSGNGLVAGYAALLIFSFVLFVSGHTITLWKTATLVHILNSIFIFFLLSALQTQTYFLGIHGIAPVFSAFLLLIGDMLLLYFWHQLNRTGD